jgi:hypothetical protein
MAASCEKRAKGEKEDAGGSVKMLHR